MRRVVVLVAISALAACGAQPPDLPDVEPPGCAYCEVEPVFDPEPDLANVAPVPRLSAVPQELTFYATADEAGALSRTVTVSNTTSSTVALTRVYVVDQQTLTGESTGDSSFFDVGAANLDDLSPADEVQIEVSFDPSSEQRTAWLVIETTHPAYESLVVELSGKTFLGW